MTTTTAHQDEAYGQALVQTVDVKIEQNTKGYNVSVHVYEFADQARIDKVIEHAVYAMKRTNERILEELRFPK
jgi:hypothetical protein